MAAAQTNAVEPMHLSYQGDNEMASPRRLIIPVELGLRAACEYIIAGQRPTCIDWEEMVE